MIPPEQPLQQRVIVVIGGTTGLGLAGAQACVAAGAHVVAVGRSSDSCAAAAAQLGPQAGVLSGDATNPETSVRAIEHAIDRFGRLDGLYHVAGGSGRKFGDGPLAEISDEGWHKTLDMNLNCLFYSNRAAVQQFLKQGTGGSVLNMSSVLAFAPSRTFFATQAYATAKAAILGLTRSAAAYYAPHNIRFNAIAPALTVTPMSQRAVHDQQILDFVRRKQPLDGGRVGQPQDLDAAVVFFLSSQAAFVTGQVLSIDGGWSVSEPWREVSQESHE